MSRVEVLILGRGFVGGYLAELLAATGTSYSSTTTDGRDGTIVWRLADDADSNYSALPVASVVVVTFPLQGHAAATRLIDGYGGHWRAGAAGGSSGPRWIYLGSSRAFTEVPSNRFTTPSASVGGLRTEAEECIIGEHGGCVLNLVGLWGGAREPEKWGRFYTKDRLRKRIEDRSLHLIHGADAARAICAVATSSLGTGFPGGRWLVSDGRVYDILQIVASDGNVHGLLAALLEDKHVQGLLGASRVEDVPMGEHVVTQRIDSSHFWSQFGIEPRYPYAFGGADPYRPGE
ncbi:hypothetical protein LPJ61_001595 [Coemansia biformis]|uniref:Uncharacterized protein n=1 Tax=Coemansia biformis TaxID=1286918 RepID=A0A9W8CXY7_9FUNG|nr:hypothetical protein LPJ61_001595 [Coemansia biformis]